MERKRLFALGQLQRDIFLQRLCQTNQKLFNGQVALINPFTSRRYYYENVKEPDTPRNILPHHIVYIARTDNFNGDNGLDTEDPQYLYISSKTGDNLKQVTPKGMNVVFWTLSKDKKMILVKLENDKNGNKKFGNGDDELYYRVKLQDDSFYPRSILVLSPIFNLRVSPLRPVSLPIIEASKTISKRLEKEPIIEFLIIE
jgi:hypothetical protein